MSELGLSTIFTFGSNPAELGNDLEEITINTLTVSTIQGPVSSVTIINPILNGTISGTALGTPNGLATLDGTGKVPASQLPGSSPTTQNLSVAGGANANPTLPNTFITTTGGPADATGTLAAGTTDGQTQYVTVIASTTNYVLTLTGIASTGVPFTTATFMSAGQSAQFIWSSTAAAWFVLGSGAVLS